MTNHRYYSIIFVLLSTLLCSCSMTRDIPDGEQLFRGLTKIEYADEQKNDSFAAHLATTKEEVEAALASAPNGSLFGSSYYCTPWSFRLWVYNHFSHKQSAFARWMTKSFGKPPVLMSQVNPALRASVAQSVLRSQGYFRGAVGYEPVAQRNPKKSKLRYTIRLDSLFRFDSVAYTNFPPAIRQLIDSTRKEAVVGRGTPVSVDALDQERTRLTTLFRNNGYYYYAPSYASYLADTLAVENRAQLQLRMADGLPGEALHQWYIGKLSVNFRKSMRDQLTDSIQRRFLTFRYNGGKSPIRPSAVTKNLKLRPRQLYNYDKYQESASRINATGVFQSVDFQFTPRDADTLDLQLNCTFAKPYDFYLETNLTGSTIGRYGPEVKVGFTRLNAFRGAEKLDINLHGSYEWQTGSKNSGASNYQYGIDASIEFPRIIAPFYDSDRTRRGGRSGQPRRRKRRNYDYAPTTLAKISADVAQRPEYYKLNVVSGEWAYRWQSSAQSTHSFSPLVLKHQRMSDITEKFDSVMTENPYLNATLSDYMIPKISYTYTYHSPSTRRHPVRWETTIEEAGNLTSLAFMAFGKRFNERDKKLFNTPYAQHVRLETDFTKTWQLTPSSQLVGHANAGVIVAYGNTASNLDVPFSELFYAGGANSIRAFGIREIGPGSFNTTVFNRHGSYIFQNGNLRLVGNLEYRAPLFGDLRWAVFLDAGNTWRFNEFSGIHTDSDNDPEAVEFLKRQFGTTSFRLSNLLDQTALGTGIGLRYDLGFLVIRIDWGVALHIPYDTGKSGYFNVNRFKDAHTLHFAIGYPF